MKNKLIFLYVKESPFGLKYLGITIKNPYKYSGSGKYWKLHLKKHSIATKDINTTILVQSIDKKEIEKMGLYYSKLWDIVNNDNWANLMPEAGYKNGTLGNKQSKQTIEKRINKTKGKKRTVEQRKRISDSVKGYKHTEETKKKMSEDRKGISPSQEIIQKRVDGRRGYLHSEQTKLKMKQNSENSIKVINKETGEIYSSISEAAEKLNIKRGTLNYRLLHSPEKSIIRIN